MSVYVVSDLHGHYNLYKQIKEFLKSEDRVICLGDCGDRGPQSWETIKAVAGDPQWTYLMGNHEHMLAGAMLEYLDDSRVNRFFEIYPGCGGSMQALCAYNGGFGSLEGWIDDGANLEWANFLTRLPVYAPYKTKDGKNTFHLSHAGYSPDKKPTRFDLIWNREHFDDQWPDGHDNEIIVHGHTPCYCFKGWKPKDGVLFYANGHKIDIDMGTAETKQAVLFDLDTSDEHYFYDKEDK